MECFIKKPKNTFGASKPQILNPSSPNQGLKAQIGSKMCRCTKTGFSSYKESGFEWNDLSRSQRTHSILMVFNGIIVLRKCPRWALCVTRLIISQWILEDIPVELHEYVHYHYTNYYQNNKHKLFRYNWVRSGSVLFLGKKRIVTVFEAVDGLRAPNILGYAIPLPYNPHSEEVPSLF